MTYSLTDNTDAIKIVRTVERERGFLGLLTSAIGDEPAVGAQPYVGLRVTRVDEDTPAEEAGVVVGDTILAFDGETMSNPQRLRFLVEHHDLNQPAVLSIERPGGRRDVPVRLRTKTEKEVEVDRFPVRSILEHEHTGGKFGQLGTEVAPYFFAGGELGVILLDIQPGSPFFYTDLRPGDVLFELNGARIVDIETLVESMRQLAHGRIQARFTVLRGMKKLAVETWPRSSYGRRFSLNIPVLVEHRLRTERTVFDLVWGLLFNYEWEASYDDNEPTTQREWGLVLNLIRYERDHNSHEFRLLWLIPIRW